MGSSSGVGGTNAGNAGAGGGSNGESLKAPCWEMELVTGLRPALEVPGRSLIVPIAVLARWIEVLFNSLSDVCKSVLVRWSNRISSPSSSSFTVNERGEI